MKIVGHLRSWVLAHQLPTFIIISVIVTLVFTWISLSLYLSSGAIRLDLSRPGYESVRQEVAETEGIQQPYSSTGALDEAALKEFYDRYNKQQETLSKLGDFNLDALSDENLGLVQVAEEVTN